MQSKKSLVDRKRVVAFFRTDRSIGQISWSGSAFSLHLVAVAELQGHRQRTFEFANSDAFAPSFPNRGRLQVEETNGLCQRSVERARTFEFANSDAFAPSFPNRGRLQVEETHGLCQRSVERARTFEFANSDAFAPSFPRRGRLQVEKTQGLCQRPVTDAFGRSQVFRQGSADRLHRRVEREHIVLEYSCFAARGRTVLGVQHNGAKMTSVSDLSPLAS